MFELGCGNGRDAVFFAENNITVYASDMSKNALDNLRKSVPSYLENKLIFINEDFTNLVTEKYKASLDSIYSRFTLHTIFKDKIDNVLEWSFKSLKSNGLILIETRSNKDPMCASSKGVLIDKNTYLYEKGHIRHFVEKKEIVNKIRGIGFKIDEVTESNNLSIVENDNPVLLRVIARKNY